MSWVATVMALMLSIIGRRPISVDVRSPGLGGNRSVGMTQIAALVAPPHVVDHGIRPLALHLERSDQRILRRHRHALVFASDVYADGEFEHHGGFFLATLVGRGARFGVLELREQHL